MSLGTALLFASFTMLVTNLLHRHLRMREPEAATPPESSLAGFVFPRLFDMKDQVSHC
ncbi:hypothetical protein [Melittangium boletus]|uniref:Uncharacterized protein n=1 Tax=Melittangium boletus DSM 14713 TaxID=1294270 RepID=A0A250IPS4_9BACT|nr:hypothetical protein [Melittangium boletus]ATB33278.1 hypothetical protein MEBOL_006769 [Melittangium boletus DSM 14713]